MLLLHHGYPHRHLNLIYDTFESGIYVVEYFLASKIPGKEKL